MVPPGCFFPQERIRPRKDFSVVPRTPYWEGLPSWNSNPDSFPGMGSQCRACGRRELPEPAGNPNSASQTGAGNAGFGFVPDHCGNVTAEL